MTRLGAVVTGLACVMVIVVVAGVVAFSKISGLTDQTHSLTKQLQGTIHDQTRNRSANVGLWCNALNSQRTVLTQYVTVARRIAPEIQPLRLQKLPCAALQARTVKSGGKPSPHPSRSKSSH